LNPIAGICHTILAHASCSAVRGFVTWTHPAVGKLAVGERVATAKDFSDTARKAEGACVQQPRSILVPPKIEWGAYEDKLPRYRNRKAESVGEIVVVGGRFKHLMHLAQGRIIS
jgi:hypothetical protein